MAEEYDGKVVFVGVSNNDTILDGKEFVHEYDVPYAMAHSPEVWELYDVPYQPVTIVLNQRGREVKRFDGPVEGAEVEAALQRVL